MAWPKDAGDGEDAFDDAHRQLHGDAETKIQAAHLERGGDVMELGVGIVSWWRADRHFQSGNAVQR